MAIIAAAKLTKTQEITRPFQTDECEKRLHWQSHFGNKFLDLLSLSLSEVLNLPAAIVHILSIQ